MGYKVRTVGDRMNAVHKNSQANPLFSFICNCFIPNFVPVKGTEIPLGHWFAVLTQRYYTQILHRMKVYDLDRWFVVLVAIAESDGHMSQQELAKQLLMDKVSMVRALDLLSNKGYVERINCPDDRRKHHIRLLPKAKPVVKAIKKAYAEVNALILGPMSETARNKFLRDVQSMLERMPTDGMKPAQLSYTKKLPK